MQHFNNFFAYKSGISNLNFLLLNIKQIIHRVKSAFPFLTQHIQPIFLFLKPAGNAFNNTSVISSKE